MESIKKLRIGDKAIPIIIALVAVVVVGMIAAVVYKKQDKVETQRTARIIEINGPCSVLREGATINAVVDMPLYSGDTFFSGVNASARIMIDDDKFIYLDAATRINFTATGTPEETHTVIFVETGSMLTEVKEKLAEGESFDIVTPNTDMEIHGTDVLTKVTIVEGSDGEPAVETDSAVLQGGTVLNTIVADGETIMKASENMAAGSSNSITSENGQNLSSEELLSLVQTGLTTNGLPAQDATYAEAGVRRGEADFGNDLLDRVEKVLQESALESELAGRAPGPDSDGNGLADYFDNVNELRQQPEGEQRVADAQTVEPAPAEPEPDPEPAEADEEEPQSADDEEAARLAQEQEAARLAADEQRTQEILAVEAAMAQVAEQEAARIAAEQEAARVAAEEEAARLAAEEAQRNADQQRREQAQRDEQEAREREEREAAERAAAEAAAAEEAARQQEEEAGPSTPPSDVEEEGDPYIEVEGVRIYTDSNGQTYIINDDGIREDIEYDPVDPEPTETVVSTT